MCLVDNNESSKANFMAEIKASRKTALEADDYLCFAKFMAAGAIEVFDQWYFASQSSLLDVGCGFGQISIHAAKNGLSVTGIDIAKSLIEQARAIAVQEQVTVRFDHGDAEYLPYLNNSFDNITSMFGTMFSPLEKYAVKEIARVLKSGGKLHMLNWQQHSFFADILKRVAQNIEPISCCSRPVSWVEETIVVQRLAEFFNEIKLNYKIYPQWHYPYSPTEIVTFFRLHFSPVKMAFECASSEEKRQLEADLINVVLAHSKQKNGITTITGGHYLQVIALRR